MRNILLWAQIAVSILLVTVILLQQKGQGLGSAFGGSGGIYHSKRGAEKFLFIITIVLAALFIGAALTTVIISSS